MGIVRRRVDVPILLTGEGSRECEDCMRFVFYLLTLVLYYFFLFIFLLLLLFFGLRAHEVVLNVKLRPQHLCGTHGSSAGKPAEL